MIMFGVIGAAGISNLQVNNRAKSFFFLIIYIFATICVLLTHLTWQSTDMNSSRNIFIFGFSMFSALVIPNWIMKNHTFLDTGKITIENITINSF